MQSFTTLDNLELKYLDTGLQNGSTAEDLQKPWLILIHGFTGSSLAWSRNIPALSKTYRVIVPDLRGHGESSTPKDLSSATVERLAVDLRELIFVLSESEKKNVDDFRCRVIGGSLGCAIIWYYAHLFTTLSFTHAIFVDQSPLQNRIPEDWDPPFCHKGLQTDADFAAFQKTIMETPEVAHLGTIHSCLGYLSHPDPTAEENEIKYEGDKKFFLGEAMKGQSSFYAKLMEDHTALDHRENIKKHFGPGSKSQAKVLAVASKKSGCFEPEGVLSVVEFVNGDGEKNGLARGEVVEWGGHWCYWEDREKFDALVLSFLSE